MNFALGNVSVWCSGKLWHSRLESARIHSALLGAMPLINVRTSLPALQDGPALLQELSSELASQTGKPEAYVMTLLELGVPMTFAGNHEPCAYVEVKSIGALGHRHDCRVLCIDSDAYRNHQQGVHQL